ncbi:hypothetical protein OCS_01038 [Ophiocordyceps sinensis CO18]|uniref:Uncharacterized protein n=1 Tax=Ophiocordyceps sinensis (strain Co18 / CGMCC 3.14243) TaxID=911162 RepID=T5AKY2_OPHSC|nr:hypothetical protein OCS_01038 [Ophiocordyceps sinensis CO18]
MPSPSDEDLSQRVMAWCRRVPTRYERDDPWADHGFQEAQTGARHVSLQLAPLPYLNSPSLAAVFRGSRHRASRHSPVGPPASPSRPPRLCPPQHAHARLVDVVQGAGNVRGSA